jgi:hypothetical protein
MTGISSRRAARLLGACVLFAASACSDPAMVRQPDAPAQAPITPSAQARERQKLDCVGNVRTLQVACEEAKPVDGVAARIIGKQDLFVRLASASPSYNSGTQIFSFTVTVQSLITLPMATTDGATRDNAGVQVFFEANPVALAPGFGTITVANATGQGTFTNTNQDYFQYGGQLGGVDQPELGADGILSPGETSSAKGWQLNMPNTVTTFSFSLVLSTETPAGDLVTIAPQIKKISPSPLIPGATVTITGKNFNATPGSNTVTFGGQTATVTGGTTQQLTVKVPCNTTGPVDVRVTQGGLRGAIFTGTMQVIQNTVGVGQSLVLTNPAAVGCSELTSAGGPARYVVAIFSASTSPNSNDPLQFSADVSDPSQISVVTRTPETGALARVSVPAGMRTSAQEQLADQKHAELMERNAEMYQTLRKRFGPAIARRVSAQPVQLDPALTRTFRVSNINVAGI